MLPGPLGGAGGGWGDDDTGDDVEAVGDHDAGGGGHCGRGVILTVEVMAMIEMLATMMAMTRNAP